MFDELAELVERYLSGSISIEELRDGEIALFPAELNPAGTDLPSHRLSMGIANALAAFDAGASTEDEVREWLSRDLEKLRTAA